MSDASRSVYRAFAIPDLRATWWAAEATVTQAGPRAGVPVPNQTSALAVRARGAQTAGTELVIRTQRAGLPVGEQGAGYVWRYDADATTDVRGWDPPNAISQYEAVRICDGTGSFDLVSTQDPHALGYETDAGYYVLCAYQVEDNAASELHAVVVSIRAPSTGTWSTVEVFAQASAPTMDWHPCMIRLPSGRILLYHWTYDTIQVEYNIRAWHSDDDGATWSIAQVACLRTAVDGSYTPGRIRAAYGAGGVVLVAQYDSNVGAETYRLRWAQYASSDLGLTFDLVENLTNGDAIKGTDGDIVYVDGTFCYVYSDAGDGKARLIGSPYSAFSDVTAVSVGSTTFDDVCACLDETGSIWCYGTTQVNISKDAGRTWTNINTTSVNWSMYATSTPRNMTVAPLQGRIVLLMNATIGGSTFDDSLHCAYLGGWSQVTRPGFAIRPSAGTRTGWLLGYLPWGTPAGIWSNSGTATWNVSNGYLVIAATTSTNRWVTHSYGIALSADHSLTFNGSFAVTAGGSTTADESSLLLTWADGAASYRLRLRFSTTAMLVRDVVGASTVTPVAGGTSIAFDVASGVDILASMQGANFRIYYRARDTGYDRQWTLGWDSTLTDGTTTYIVPGVSFGVENNPAATTTMRTYWIGHVGYQYAGVGLTSYTPLADAFPRGLTPRGTWTAEGVTVEAVDGPTIIGETWNIATEYRYAQERAYSLARPSPRLGWRSTGTSAVEYLPLQVDSIADSRGSSDVIAIPILAHNLASVEVQGYDADTAAWVSLGTHSLAHSGLPYARNGATVRPSATPPTVAPYYSKGELAGGYFVFSTTRSRVIRSNRSGKWGVWSASAPRCVLDLGGITGAEASAGTGKIITGNAVIILHLAGTLYSGYRLVIPTAATQTHTPPEGYWKIGHWCVYSVEFMPDEYGWGRTLNLGFGTELIENDDGTSTAWERAPSAREVGVSWVDGVDTSLTADVLGEASPDYLMASDLTNAESVGSPNDTPMWLDGLLREIGGSNYPVFYLPYVPKLTSPTDETVLTRRSQFLFARVVSDVSVETVLGDELTDELVRVATVTLREVT